MSKTAKKILFIIIALISIGIISLISNKNKVMAYNVGDTITITNDNNELLTGNLKNVFCTEKGQRLTITNVNPEYYVAEIIEIDNNDNITFTWNGRK